MFDLEEITLAVSQFPPLCHGDSWLYELRGLRELYMCQVLRTVPDIGQASWKCIAFRIMMMGLNLKFASMYYILFVCYLL